MPNPKYDEEFKKNIVSLIEGGKSKSQVSKDYNVSLSAINKWVKLYSVVRVDENTVLTAKQVKELQKRNAQLEEENLILKKAIAIFTPHSEKGWMQYTHCAFSIRLLHYAEFWELTEVHIISIFPKNHQKELWKIKRYDP